MINQVNSKTTTNKTALDQLYTYYFTFSYEIAVGPIVLSLSLQLSQQGPGGAEALLRGSIRWNKDGFIAIDIF